MGYWNATRDGKSLQTEDTGLIWGDAPADVINMAIKEIRETFRKDLEREPTAGEIRSGLEFALMFLPDDEPASGLDEWTGSA